NVVSAAEGGNLRSQILGDRADAICIPERPQQACEVAGRIHVAIEIISANAYGGWNILEASEPSGKETGGREVVAPAGVGGMFPDEPVEQLQSVRHGGVPFAEAPHSKHRRIAFLRTHDSRLERTGPSEHVDIGSTRSDGARNAPGAGSHASHIGRISFGEK